MFSDGVHVMQGKSISIGILFVYAYTKEKNGGKNIQRGLSFATLPCIIGIFATTLNHLIDSGAITKNSLVRVNRYTIKPIAGKK